MRILFAPTHLAKAKQADVLRRAVDEFESEAPDAELRVVQVWRDQPLKLILRRPGFAEAIAPMPKEWLYEDQSEWDVRAHLLDLLRASPTGTKA